MIHEGFREDIGSYDVSFEEGTRRSPPAPLEGSWIWMRAVVLTANDD
jgi:hypothetical protein